MNIFHNEWRMNMKSMRYREDVDQEHTITLEGGNVTVYFLKESTSKALKEVEELLLDAFESRMCKTL